MNTLNLGDELFDIKANCVAMVVTNPTITMDRVCVLQAGADAERWVLYKDIRARIEVGELELRGKGHLPPSVFIDRNDETTCKRKVPRQQVPGAKEDTYLASVARANRIVRMLKDHCKRYKVSAHVAYAEVRQQFEAECSDWEFPSLATAYRLLERDRCNTRLVTPNYVKGNRDRRHEIETIDLICKLAKKTFLQEKSKWTLRKLADACRREAIRAGHISAEHSLSKKFVRKVVVTRLEAMPEVARLLGKERAAKASVARHRIRVEGILQRVEQDAVHLPFVIQTPDGPCSDVWLIHAIDCGSSNVVGWYLKIGAPNESDGLRCIESSVFSKGASFKYFGIDDCHDLYGVPALLILDNGGEATGNRFRRMGELGTDVHYLPSRQPQKKPFIERLNLSVKRGLETLGGCTRVDDKDGQRDPVALGDKLMTLQELERWIVRWYFDQWSDGVLERFVDEDVFEDRDMGVTPRQRFENIVERDGHPLPLPPNRSAWQRIKYNLVVRKLSIKSGITLDGFEFRGDNLLSLIERFGEETVDVLQDPDDFRRVYVLDGDELVEMTNQAAGECTPAYSFEQAKERKALRMGFETETPRSAAFADDLYAESMQGPKKAGGAKKSPNRAQKKEVVAKTRHKDAIDRASKHPLPPSKTKTTASDASVPMQWDDVDELSPRNRNTGALI